AAADKPYGDWKKLTTGAEPKRGFFTLYAKRENLYLQINADQMDTPVLAITSLARGVGMNGILGGLPQNDQLIEFHRSGDHVLVVQQNTRFTAPAGTSVERAKNLSMGNSVLASLKVESVQDSTRAVLVDIAPLLVSDLPDLADQMRAAFGNKPMRFDKERSALGSIKVFPENMEIEATLTYSPSDRIGLNAPTVPDDRYIPVSVHYSFSKLPAKPMMPRLADDRTGYFLTVMKDFSRDDKEHFFVRYVNHWRLEKKDPSAALSEPVKPIVYYLDRTIPERYRPYIREGIERWQRAFETAGFKNAIVAKDAPNDPDFDPEDVRYSTIRWITSSPPSFGAIGPSRVDPRTGEILDADILIEASIVQRRWRNYVDLTGNAPSVSATPAPEGGNGLAGPEYRCDLQTGLGGGAALANVAMAMAGGAEADSALREKFIGEMLIHTTLHEVGHTLGLRHNFRSSTATPAAKLTDRNWTAQNGLMGSVMDYAAVNLPPDHGAPGEYYAVWPGTVDDWMIRYGYAPSSAATTDADYAFAKTIADESEQPGHEYSTDEDTGGPFALDPRTNQFDLGDDPLAFAKQRTALIASLWKNPGLESRLAGKDGEYPVLRRAVDGLLEQYDITARLAVKYVGGQYQSRNHRGQPGAHDPLTPVPAARQREALEFLAQRVFAADAFAMTPGLLNRLGPDRWSHWGVNENFGIFTGPRLDYNLNDKTLVVQTNVLDALMAPQLMARLREAESRSADAFRLAEHFDRLTRMVWGEPTTGAAATLKTLEGPGTRREVQRAYVDRLANLVVAPPPGAPDDARALARLQLSRIDGRCSRLLAAQTPIGDYARAHLMETRARIKRALDAGRESDLPAAPRPAGPFGQP
ncbi:MAG: zinc-dependent metalloprotease, partial [Candidatus Eisenbacteria bacterium]|nr:zinc-dependent metalloprotease [Candidatus Eisenbacteria bacterium]